MKWFIFLVLTNGGYETISFDTELECEQAESELIEFYEKAECRSFTWPK